jgi:uncharacterized membrane protein
MPDALPVRRPLSLAIVLIVTGVIGWYSSFALTLDKFAVLVNPDADLDCNFSLIVQCGANLQSWQGSVFGFPNPVLGLAGFVAPIAVGVAILARATFARWFWIAFNVGVAGAFAFCIWRMTNSIFALGTLCPWCMVVWSVTILMFWTLTLDNARNGVFGQGLVRAGSALYPWIPAIVLGCYLIIAIIAQLRLDVIGFLFF